jgi:hypothetical protein
MLLIFQEITLFPVLNGKSDATLPSLSPPPMEWKIEQEWLVIRYFKENEPSFPKGRLVKGEAPDFKLWIHKGKFIGIELTMIHPVPDAEMVPGFLDYRHALHQLELTVEAKEERVHTYRSQKPDSLWLIIFADYSEAHAIERILKSVDHKPLDTSFDRIYFFDIDHHTSYQIK